MASLFGRSSDEVDRLRSTVRSLGTTSVPGLAAALSLRERKVERLLAHELARPGSPVTYDPSRRLVRWAAPPAPLPGPVAGPSVVPASPASPATPRRATEPARPAIAPVLVGSRLKVACPSCHVALLDAGTGELAVCPECGRLAKGGAPDPPAPATGASGPPPSPTSTPGGDGRSPLSLADRRSQELFAAYVTSRPIPCPKCGVSLRHRGVSQYACPQCGQMVRFPKASEVGSGPKGPGIASR
jgi:predicted RNA-binding Zn-ribbon protein involved in translation (DUF1610 family)